MNQIISTGNAGVTDTDTEINDSNANGAGANETPDHMKFEQDLGPDFKEPETSGTVAPPPPVVSVAMGQDLTHHFDEGQMVGVLVTTPAGAPYPGQQVQLVYGAGDGTLQLIDHAGNGSAIGEAAETQLDAVTGPDGLVFVMMTPTNCNSKDEVSLDIIVNGYTAEVNVRGKVVLPPEETQEEAATMIPAALPVATPVAAPVTVTAPPAPAPAAIRSPRLASDSSITRIFEEEFNASEGGDADLPASEIEGALNKIKKESLRPGAAAAPSQPEAPKPALPNVAELNKIADEVLDTRRTPEFLGAMLHLRDEDKAPKRPARKERMQVVVPAAPRPLPVPPPTLFAHRPELDEQPVAARESAKVVVEAVKLEAATKTQPAPTTIEVAPDTIETALPVVETVEAAPEATAPALPLAPVVAKQTAPALPKKPSDANGVNWLKVGVAAVFGLGLAAAISVALGGTEPAGPQQVPFAKTTSVTYKVRLRHKAHSTDSGAVYTATQNDPIPLFVLSRDLNLAQTPDQK